MKLFKALSLAALSLSLIAVMFANGNRYEVVVWQETFENGAPGWSNYDGTIPPNNWHIHNTGGTQGDVWWMGDTALAQGTNVGGYYDAQYLVLDTPARTIAVGNTNLTFKLRYNVEDPAGATAPYTGWDACNVRISTDGGTVWTPIAGTPAYNITSAYSFGFQHGEGANIPGWGGVLDAWTVASFDLSAYVGQSVKIRFAFASDPASSTGDAPAMFGMMVDDIAFGGYSNNGTDDGQMVASSMVPVGGDIWAIATDPTAPSPTHIMKCQNAQGSYNPNMLNYLVSPPITLPNDGDIRADFMITGNFTDPNSFPYVDYFGWEISVNNGVTWNAMSNPYNDPAGMNYVYSGAPDTWVSMVESYTLDGYISDYAGQTIMLRWYFLSDEDTPQGTGIMIDDVTVYNDFFVAPPVNLAAAVDGNNVTITWEEPGSGGGGGEEGWLHYDGENSGNAIGTGAAADFSVAAKWDAIGDYGIYDYVGMNINKIQFFPNEADCAYTLRIWTGAAANIAYEQVVPSPTIGAWNEIVLTTPWTIPAQTQIMAGYRANTQTGQPAGCDAGPHIPGYGNMIHWQNAWTTLNALSSTLTYNWNIRIYVADPLTGKEYVLGHGPYEQEVHAYNDAPLAAAQTSMPNSTVNNNKYFRDHALSGYKVWRLLQGQESDETSWIPLTPDVITDTVFTDANWDSMPEGIFKWAVKSIYTGGVESTPAISNEIVQLEPPTIVSNIPEISIIMNGQYTLDSVETYFYSSMPGLHYEVSTDSNVDIQYLSNGQVLLQAQGDWYGVTYLTVKGVDVLGHYAEQTVKFTVTETWMYSEDFNHDGSMPDNWSQSHSGNTTYPWQPCLVDGMDYGMKTMATFGGTANERLLSPLYDLSTLKSIQVSFDTDLLPYNGGTGTFAYTLNNFTYVTVESFSEATSGMKTYSLTALNAKPSVRFRWTYYDPAANTGQDNYWIVDDFQIYAQIIDAILPAAVTGLALQGLSPGSATLGWYPSEDVYFDRYELYLSMDPEVTADDLLWTTTEDPSLNNINTTSTTITQLELGTYWVSIRAKDQSGNRSDFSSPISFTLEDVPPMLTDPIPSAQPEPSWIDNLSFVLGCTASDLNMLDLSTLAYRIDVNLNGAYDTDESWMDVPSRSINVGAGRDVYNISFNVLLPGDGIYAWELKIADICGNMAYSGCLGQEGIADDWLVRADISHPTQMSEFFVQSVSANSVQLGWSTSSDPNFAGYGIYYSTSPEVDTGDELWDWNDDTVLQYEGSELVTTAVVGLVSATRYYFLLQAMDEAGNVTSHPNIITGMTTSFAPPLAPQGLTLALQGLLLMLDWEDVTQDQLGNPINVSRYEVHVSDQPYFECSNETLVDTVTASQLTLEGVAEYADRLFFKVIAVTGGIRDPGIRRKQIK